MMLMLIAASLLLAAAVCGACSPSVEGSVGPSASPSIAASSPTDRPTSTLPATPNSRAYEDCKELVQAVLDELSDLDATITVGVIKADYGDAVTSAVAAYNKIDVAAFGVSNLACLEDVAVLTEEAVNDHISANSQWKKCLDGATAKYNSCFEKKVQPLWASATEAYETAKANLAALRP